MIAVPHCAEEILDRQSPLHGDLDDVLAQEAVVQEVASDAGLFIAFISSAGDALLGQNGRAVSHILEKLDERVTPGAHALADSADAALRGLGEYGSAIEHIHQRARGVITGVETHLRTISVAARVLDEIAREIGAIYECTWRDGPARRLPDSRAGIDQPAVVSSHSMAKKPTSRSDDEESWRLSAAAWHRAIGEIASEERRWNELVQQRMRAEATLRDALSLTAIGQLMTLSAVGGVGYRHTIAAAISGEVRGMRAPGTYRAHTHPLLPRLISTRSGAHIWNDPPDPIVVAANWATLSEQQQQRLIDEVPWVIGNLPGLPYRVRDEANRKQLQFYIVHRASLGGDSRQAVDEISRVLEDERREIALKGRANPPIQIVALHLDGAVPMSAIGYGDLDTAAHLTWQIPGMLNDTQQGLPGWNKASRNIFAEQSRQLESTGRGGERSSLVAYFEYDSPDPLTVFSADTARDAAVRLADELDGTYATRHSGVPLRNLGVLAHSYGTSVAANALLLTVYPVHTFTMIASAGLDRERVRSLSELNVARDAEGRVNVYSTMARADSTAPLGSNLSGRWQPNPNAAWSDALLLTGAQIFSSDGQGALTPTLGHSIVRPDGGGYLDRRTQSLNTAAKLTLGLPGEVTGGLSLTESRRSGGVRRGLDLQPRGRR